MKPAIKTIGNVLLSILTLGMSQRRERSEITGLDLANTREATDILIQNIVKPLQDELEQTRSLLRQTREELDTVRTRLREVVQTLNEQKPPRHLGRPPRSPKN